MPPAFSSPSLGATAETTAAPAVVELTLQQQLEKLQKEKEEADRNADLLRLSVRNLQEGQVRLHQENLHLRTTPTTLAFTPTTTVTLTPTTTTTSLSTSSSASMGFGYSSQFGVPSVSSFVGGSSSVPGYLVSAASNLVHNNSASTSTPSSIPGYSGPSLPEI